MPTNDATSHTAQELARATGARLDSIYKWIRQGHIKAVHLGPRNIRIPQAEWDRLVTGTNDAA
jgi:excisionase family DNA binding protein